jgi:aryl-alcohol dehydrogenase-like predicted oxidoreductase
MRKVVLAPGVESSVLGFGCAPILGAVGAAQARKAIACALDLGVNHFDVARCYGYGDAEKFVGGELKKRRDEVVIASKCGLEATGLARAMRPAKPLVRWLRPTRRPAHPEPKQGVSQRKSPLLRSVPITARSMVKSVEQSLRALGTDYLDILFLHEPSWGSLPLQEVAETAAGLKREGKIRAFGAAFYRGSQSFGDSPQDIFDVLQFDAPSPSKESDALRRERGDRANVLFSPFVGADPHVNPSDILGRLWREFPRSVVLCSMFNPDHIRHNAALAVQ